jgi:hypothetical protein
MFDELDPNDPHFTLREASSLSGASEIQIRTAIQLGFVDCPPTLPFSQTRPVFSFLNALNYRMLADLLAYKLPRAIVPAVWEQLVNRFRMRQGGHGPEHFAIVVFVDSAGGLGFVPMRDGEPASPVPPVCIIVDLDGQIEQTLERAAALLEGRDPPDHGILADDFQPFSPEQNLFGTWASDDRGRTVLAGLDFAQTQELGRLKSLRLRSLMQPEGSPEIFSQRAKERLHLLESIHQTARIANLFAIERARLAADTAEPDETSPENETETRLSRTGERPNP